MPGWNSLKREKLWFSLKKGHFSSFQTKNRMDQGVRWLKSCAYDCCKWCDMPRQLDLPKSIMSGRSSLKSQKIMIFTQKRSFFKFSDRKRHHSRRTMAQKLRLRLVQIVWYASSIRFADKNNAEEKLVCNVMILSKSHDFDSNNVIFQVFRLKKAWIKPYDGLKFAPTIAANDVICLVRFVKKNYVAPLVIPWYTPHLLISIENSTIRSKKRTGNQSDR